MWRMPEVCSPNTYAGVGTEENPYHLAIRGMVFGHGRAVQTARGNMTHILVMVDKFTKWIEVKPI